MNELISFLLTYVYHSLTLWLMFLVVCNIHNSSKCLACVKTHDVKAEGGLRNYLIQLTLYLSHWDSKSKYTVVK